MTLSATYIDLRVPAPNRVKGCLDSHEQHLTEAAVMIAFAMYLFAEGSKSVRICPDCEHARRHDLKRTLQANGFRFAKPAGSTMWGGTYERDSNILEVKSTPGVGDVSGTCNGRLVVAECKGGILNTKHSGQTSRLRKGLCEAVGQLIGRSQEHERHVAVVPDTPLTRALAAKMSSRAANAGIEIALVSGSGSVCFQSSKA